MIRTVNLEPGTKLRKDASFDLVVLPGNHQDAIISEAAPATNVVVGVDILDLSAATADPYLQSPCGICIAYTDAAGSGANVDVTVTGLNQFGERVSEDMSHTSTGTSEEFTQSVNCYMKVESIIVTAIASLNNADTFKMGAYGGSATAAIRCTLPLPHKGSGAGDFLGLVQINAGSAWGVQLAMANRETVFNTFDLNTTASAANMYYLLMAPDEALEIR